MLKRRGMGRRLLKNSISFKTKARNRGNYDSRKDAKHALSEVEGDAKAGDGIKIVFTGGNGDNRDELTTSFSLFSPVRRGFFASCWHFSPTFNKISLQLRGRRVR
jgi:hypothetical protein